MEGMSIIMLAMFFLCVLIPIIIVSAVMGLLLSFVGIPLIYKLKHIPKDKRRIGFGRKIILSIPLGIVSGLLISVGTLLYITHGSALLSSPEDIFQDATDLALPPGITIIDSQHSTGFRPERWLHFTASPQDIAAILASDKFVEQTNFSYDFSSYKPPSWWLPKTLGANVRYYTCQDKFEEEHLLRKCIFVNAETNEVFFLKIHLYLLE